MACSSLHKHDAAPPPPHRHHPQQQQHEQSPVFLVSAKLVAAAVLPHGDFALAPDLLDAGTAARRAADKVANAARIGATWLDRVVQPTILLLSTPHGMEVTNDFVLYQGSTGHGHVDLGQDLHNNKTDRKHRRVLLPHNVLLSPELTKDLLDSTLLDGQNVTGLQNFADSEPMPLRWGEVVPLLLLSLEHHHQNNNTNSTPTASTDKNDKVHFSSSIPSAQDRQHMILSHPLRRYTEAPTMVQELLSLGRSIRAWADQRPEDIAILVSADLAHTHRADGPYGYSPASARFDAAVGAWADDPIRNSHWLLEEAAGLQTKAQCCGFTGMVMLHGALSGNGEDNMFDSMVLANQNATYYGMMVALFQRKNRNGQGEPFPATLVS